MARRKDSNNISTLLYHGDNLQVLQARLADASIDLAYIDPPFNSQQYYNLRKPNADRGRQAFADVWTWDAEAQRAFAAACGCVDSVAQTLEGFRRLLGRGPMLAYLTMMVPRLHALHRVLKSTGSLYVHCDPSASHYLKLALDALFGAKQFRNEIIWRRTAAHGARRTFGGIHDTLLFYSKTDRYFFDGSQRRPYMAGHVKRRYVLDARGRNKFVSGGNVLTGPGKTGGDSGAAWRGFDPTSKNRHWAIPTFLAEQMPEAFALLRPRQKLEALYQQQLIEIKPGSRWPTPVRFLRSQDGQSLQDIWAYQPYTEGTVFGSQAGIDADVAWLGTTAPERRWYPTQKPEGLLARIISSSSPPGGSILDAFCGCGTTLAAAQRLGRPWIGIDCSPHAISLVQRRLNDQFGVRVPCLRLPQAPKPRKSSPAARGLPIANGESK